MSTAILIDGAYFIKRFRALEPWSLITHTTPSELQIAFFAGLWRICHHRAVTVAAKHADKTDGSCIASFLRLPATFEKSSQPHFKACHRFQQIG